MALRATIFDEIKEIKDPQALEIIQHLLEEVRLLQVEVLEQSKRITELEEEVASLKKDSSNSSKPPSSDITKPKKNLGRGKRKRGGRRGREGKSREKFLASELDEQVDLSCSCCPDCGEDLSDVEISSMIKDQSVELVAKPTRITQYNRGCKDCPKCHLSVCPKLPAGVVEGQLFGMRLQSFIAYMKGHLGCSYTELSQFCEDVLEIKVSRGMLSDVVFRVSKALKTPYEELKNSLKDEQSLNIDETGWKDDGSQHWVWLFCNNLIAFFTVSKTRGSVVLREVLGETFGGAIISDFFSAYTAYANELQQFCLAHLIRDIKYLTTLPDEESKLFGEKLLRYFRRIFKLWHAREELTEEEFQKKATRVKNTLSNFLAKTQLKDGKARTLQKRLLKRWEQLFCFFDNPELFSPTNNLAEQTLRHLIRIRRHTQGTRGIKGQKWIERSMSVLESCRKQKRSPWTFFLQAFQAVNGEKEYPSLLIA